MRTSRVLFVDDDREVLSAMQRMLRKYRDRWELVFALGGPAAVEAVHRETFDVVITDMRMPEVDGPALLVHVRDRDPTTFRMVLSGFSDQGAVTRALPLAHQFFDKPCDPKALTATIERACALRAVFADELVRVAVERVGPLPSPALYHQLAGMLCPDAITAAIAREPAIAARIVRFARAGSISEAVVQLGQEACIGLALLGHTLELFAGSEALEQRAFDAGRHAGPDSFCSALLSHLGAMVIAAGERTAGERATLGAMHAEIGAYVLARWCVPFSLIEAVAQHIC